MGPFCVIGENAEVGEGTRLLAHAAIDGWTRIGRDNEIGYGAVIGAPPQDHKYAGGRSFVVIGDRNIIREYVTIHRSATTEGSTTVGNDNFMMAYVHLAHDVQVGSHVTLTNMVGLSGHIEVGDHAVLGGMTPYHQHVHVGAYAMVGGGCRVRMDVVPFALAMGEPLRIYGVNRIGLRRQGFSRERLQALKDAYRILFWSGLPFSEAVARLRADTAKNEDVGLIVKFIERSRRGLTPGLKLGEGAEEPGEEE